MPQSRVYEGFEFKDEPTGQDPIQPPTSPQGSEVSVPTPGMKPAELEASFMPAELEAAKPVRPGPGGRDPVELIPGDADAVRQRRQRLGELARWSAAQGGGFRAEEPAAGPGLRFDMARSSTFEDKRKKFLRENPAGEMAVVPTSQGRTVMARPSRGEAWRELDPSGADIGDIGDISAGIVSEPTVAGGLGYALGGPVLGIAGTVAGELGQYGLERYRGYGSEDFSTAATRAGTSGALAAAGEAAVPLGTRALSALNLFKPQSFLQPGSMVRTGQAGERGIAAQEELNREFAPTLDDFRVQGFPEDDARQLLRDNQLPPLTAGQAARSPLTRGMYQQAGTLSKRVQDKLTEQERALKERLETLGAPGNFEGLSDENLDKIVELQNRELNRALRMVPVDRETAAENLRQGLKKWRRASAALRDRAYRRAFENAENVTFDLSPAQQVAREIEQGTRARTQRGGTMRVGGGELPSELKSVIEDIKQMDPAVTTVREGEQAYTGFEQLKDLRTRLFDLTREEGQTGRQARRLWQSLRGVMDNPLNASDEFLQSYRRASQLHAAREGYLGLNAMTRALNEKVAPTEFAQRYFRPGMPPENIQTFKKLIPRPEWRRFVEGFKTNLLREAQSASNPGRTLRRRIEQFESNPGALNTLLGDDELQSLKQYADLLERAESGVIRNMLNSNLDVGERALKLAKAGRQEISQAVDEAGGPNSSFARAGRAAFYQRLLDRAQKVSEDTGETVIDPGKLVQEIENMQKEMNFFPLMSESDKRILENLRDYANVIRQKGDVGGPMQAGEVRSGIFNVLRPDQQVGALSTVGKNELTAWLLGSKAMRTLPSRQANKSLSSLVGTTIRAYREMGGGPGDVTGADPSGLQGPRPESLGQDWQFQRE